MISYFDRIALDKKSGKKIPLYKQIKTEIINYPGFFSEVQQNVK